MSIRRPPCRLWFSSLLGLLCYIGFVVFRTKFRLYFARLDMPQVSRKPPEMRTDGHHRFWSWLVPVFAVSDDDLLASAGLDELVAMRIISFGMMLFLPVTIVVTAILLPINYTDNYYTNEAEDGNYQDDYTTVFIRLTMSNLTPGTRFMWWVDALIAPLKTNGATHTLPLQLACANIVCLLTYARSYALPSAGCTSCLFSLSWAGRAGS
jgi:hypothetical protein